MPTPPRHIMLLSTTAAAMAIALVACGTQGTTGNGGSTAQTAASGQPGQPPASLQGEPSPDAEPGASGSITQTDTEWGRIWDGLPAGFPRYPGAAPADDAAAAPASARYQVSGSDPEAIAAWLQVGMETAGFSTDVAGPLEDRTMTLDSVGDAGCRIQTTIAPLGGMTFVTVLYGSDCPIR
jgi:hypothetical protein